MVIMYEREFGENRAQAKEEIEERHVIKCMKKKSLKRRWECTPSRKGWSGVEKKEERRDGMMVRTYGWAKGSEQIEEMLGKKE